MEFRLLGPVEAWASEHPVQLGGTKPRTLLTVLLVEHDQVVPGTRLIDAIWGSDPPDRARNVLQTYISTLRQVLARVGGTDMIVTRPPGYTLRLAPHTLDRDVFERLLAQGRAAAADHRHRDAAELLRAASAQWRGAALGGAESELLAGEAARLNDLRMAAVEDRINADLELGRFDEVSAELADLVNRYPFRERLRGQLMRALSGLGRRPEALVVYQNARTALVEELGIEPGPELQAIQNAILRDEPPASEPNAGRERSRAGRSEQPGPGSPEDAPGAAPRTTPAQLPPVPADFTGRETEVLALATALTDQAPVVPVHVVAGKGGSGKSALAARVAHTVAPEYPAGQLYADLRGMSETPAEPREVLGRFLQALGIAPADLPETTEARIGRYRTLMAGKRMLVLLDDAGTEQQVRPLLPGTPGCSVIITSRSRLMGLAGPSVTELDVMGTDESLALLTKIVNAERVENEPDAARWIAAQCGGLPLAIRVAGARLASRQRWPLQLLADRLADERRRLDELSVGDQEVRASISLSYRTLDPEAQSALRILGLLGLPDFPSWIVAAALRLSELDGEQAVERLVDAQLVDFTSIDGLGDLRYRMHDLVRIFARERAEAEETVDTRNEIVCQVVGHWLWLIQTITAGSPSGQFDILEKSPVASAPYEGVTRRVAANHQIWFDAEHNALITAVEVAAGMGLDQVACDLARALSTVEYSKANRFDAWTRTHDAALQAARRSGNRYGEAILLSGFGELRYAQDRYTDAKDYLRQALDAFRQDKDARGEATTLAGLGQVCREQGHLAESLHFFGRAAVIVEELGDDNATGFLRRLAGSVRVEQGDYPAAYQDLTEALAAYRRSGSRRGEAMTQRSLALYHRSRGELDEALEQSSRALDGFRQVGDALLEAYGLRALGKTLVRLDRPGEAEEPLQRSLAICQEIDDRWGQAATLRVLGELALSTGELDRAERLLNSALGRWDELGLPLWRARTLRDLVWLHTERGDTEAAATAATEAVSIFESFGSREYGELVDALQEKL
ncbi:AfsR/SARP family transcriptional regulator [Micromonospora sp. NPDC050397]|uniref:AfsR/SARP family transcriptional regulator n=1 Tax=Micromonospora sp. NPDC050397 TaxID=3364279 RepID=UPI00384CBDDE